MTANSHLKLKSDDSKMKNVVITGANSGIGFQSALHFAKKGDRVIMACRSLDKAEKAQADILAQVPDAQIVIIRLDVSSLASVREFAEEFARQVGELALLINNAGIVAIPMERNSNGHEMQLATNYLGTFALSGLLLPNFAKDKPGRIVNVGSLAHRFGKLNIANLNWEVVEYDMWKSYANSKVAVMSHTLELNRRLQENGSNIIAVGAHPGFANTNINQNSPALAKRKESTSWFSKKMQELVPSAEAAAQPIILAAESETVKGGDYYGPRGFLEIGGKPGKAKIKKVAKDAVLAKELWTATEQLTGVSYLS